MTLFYSWEFPRFLYHFLFIRVNPKINRKRLNRKRSRNRGNSHRNREKLILKYLLGSIFSALESKLQEICINIYMLSMQNKKQGCE